MLNGMVNASAGTATLFGREIGTDMAEIRKFMGVCPQHDTLWFATRGTRHVTGARKAMTWHVTARAYCFALLCVPFLLS
jgi:ABC-type multidrug transport system ATPase subunit